MSQPIGFVSVLPYSWNHIARNIATLVAGVENIGMAELRNLFLAFFLSDVRRKSNHQVNKEVQLPDSARLEQLVVLEEECDTAPAFSFVLVCEAAVSNTTSSDFDQT